MQQEGAIPKGVWFKVLTPRNDAGRVSKILYDLGRKGMFLESALYQFFRVKDPVTCEQIAAAIEEKKKTGKYPRLAKFEVVSADLTAACKFLSDGMGSNIYSAISYLEPVLVFRVKPQFKAVIAHAEVQTADERQPLPAEQYLPTMLGVRVEHPIGNSTVDIRPHSVR